MRTKLLAAVLAVTAATWVLAATAMGSGPAAPGKDTIDVTCEGVGTVTVSVPRSENNNGAGQIVDAKGHGIGVAFTFTLTDVTTSTVIFSDSAAVGGGNAHPNQATTHCSGVFFEGPASVFFGIDLPPGVAATDTVRAAFEGEIIIKL
jgi:hypothetical protein